MFCCEVIDTGRGIPNDKLKLIFEPFAQLSGSRQVREGTGLGLTITKQLVELMHGHLMVESEEGKGSIFRVEVSLPMVSVGELGQERHEYPIVGYLGERKKLLLVDDNLTNISMLVSLLEPLGFEILTAENGAVALELAIKESPDLVVMDLVMPELNGLDTAREIKRHPELVETRIIGVSASVTPSEQKEAFQDICDGFLPKPVKLEQLLDKLTQLLGIEWEMATEAPLAVISGTDTGKNGLPMPVPANLDELHELALRGDMRQLRLWAEKQVESSPEHREFAAELLGLAQGFKTKSILALLERCRG
jgi:CheY-like chemotaxis protein